MFGWYILPTRNQPSISINWNQINNSINSSINHSVQMDQPYTTHSYLEVFLAQSLE